MESVQAIVYFASLRALVLLAAILVLYIPVAWIERWASLPPGERAQISRRPFLPLTHAVKLIGRRGAILGGADAVLHHLGPFVALLPGILFLAQLPFAPPVKTEFGPVAVAVMGGYGNLPAALSLLFVTPFGILVAGVAGGSHLSSLGGLRLALVRSSALVVVAVSTLGVANLHGSILLQELVIRQGDVFFANLPALGVLINPLGFGAGLVALAVLNAQGQRDRPEVNADLVESHLHVAAGPTLLGHRVVEVIELLGAAGLLTVVFFGGWTLPTDGRLLFEAGVSVDQAVWRTAVFSVKALLSIVLILSVRRALPPLQHDQAIRLAWLVLVPIAFAGVLASRLMPASLGV